MKLAHINTDEVEASCGTHRDAVGIFLADALSFRLALLEGVLVLELRSHGGGSDKKRVCSV
jgi:hypothetical protein